MTRQRLRWLAFVVLCGGTLFQTTAGCEQFLAPFFASLASSVVSTVLSSVLNRFLYST